jgi:hypothetical protein
MSKKKNEDEEFNLDLKKFDMRIIKDDETVVFIGPRNTGKSFLVKDLLYYHRHIPVGTCISPTEEANKCFSDHIPPIFIHPEYTPELIEKVVNRQKEIVTKKRNGGTEMDSIDPNAFLLMDDCLYDRSWVKDKSIREIFMNGRHWKLLFLLTMQFPLGITPNLRSNVDWVFILKNNIMADRKRIYEHYAGMFPNFEIFCETLNQCTENYECLVIHKSSKSNKLEDQVYWYKAEIHDNFKIGYDVFWQHNNKYYDSTVDSKTEASKNSKAGLKRKLNVNINKTQSKEKIL